MGVGFKAFECKFLPYFNGCTREDTICKTNGITNDDIRREITNFSITHKIDKYSKGLLGYVKGMADARFSRQAFFYKLKGNEFTEDREKDGVALLTGRSDNNKL